MKRYILLVIFFAASGISLVSGATTYYSRQSGNWNDPSTWSTVACGGTAAATAPHGYLDYIDICNGYTVTLTADDTIGQVMIRSGGVLDNGNYNLGIMYEYYNYGIHNAALGGISTLSSIQCYGSGTVNCDIECRNGGGPVFRSGCILTINGNIYEYGTSAMYLYNEGDIIINGNITCCESNYPNILNIGTINQTGNLTLCGSGGTNVENQGTYNISGNLSIGSGVGYFWNHGGTVSIGGDVLGSGIGQSYFAQEANSTAKFGGQMFPVGNDGGLAVVGTSAFIAPAGTEPNTIEYTGSGQTIKTPNTSEFGYTDGAYSNLTIANTPGNASINGNISVNGTLNFTSGKIILGTYNIILSTPTAITGYNASNYIVTDNTGYLQINGITTPAIDFPVGISTSSYTPAQINNNGAGATATDFSVRVADKVYSAQGNVQMADMVDRTWHITASGGTANTTLTLQWNAAEEIGTFDRTDCGISHYTAPAWDVPPTHGAATGTGPYTQTRSGISTFSPFAIEEMLSIHILPIELLSFAGELNEKGQAVLNWTTATETNNDYFTVERGIPSVQQTSLSPTGGGESLGITFIPIGIIKGAGNSTIPLYYHLLDETPFPWESTGVRYYRLKQTDYDGKSSYSQIISVTRQYSSSLIIYPNPATDDIVQVNIFGNKEESLNLSVIDRLGRKVIGKEENIEKGSNSIHLNVSGLSTGAYLLQIITTSGVKEQRQLMINKQ